MNIFSALLNLAAGTFLTGRQAQEEKEQEGPAGQAYEDWLNANGYEAQYQAYRKQHGTNEGFVYKDPGNPPT